MEIKGITVIESGVNERGMGYSVRLSLPFFADEATKCERVNKFYGSLGEIIRKSAEREGINVVSEYKICCNCFLGVSLYTDILIYRDKQLIDCFRLCDTRDRELLSLSLPQKYKKKAAGSDGWYYDGERLVICFNRFPKGSGENIRRSAYRQFIEEKSWCAKTSDAFGGRGTESMPVAESDTVPDV